MMFYLYMCITHSFFSPHSFVFISFWFSAHSSKYAWFKEKKSLNFLKPFIPPIYPFPHWRSKRVTISSGKKKIASKRHERYNFSNFSTSAQLIWGRAAFSNSSRQALVFYFSKQIKHEGEIALEAMNGNRNSTIVYSIELCIWTEEDFHLLQTVDILMGNNENHCFPDNTQE